MIITRNDLTILRCMLRFKLYLGFHTVVSLLCSLSQGASAHLLFPCFALAQVQTAQWVPSSHVSIEHIKEHGLEQGYHLTYIPALQG